MILGASWVDKGSTKRARKATRALRRAFGTCMEAKCSNMEQKAKTIDFTSVCACVLMNWEASCVDKGSKKRARKATRAPRRAFGSIESATRHQKIIGGLPPSEKAEYAIGVVPKLFFWNISIFYKKM